MRRRATWLAGLAAAIGLIAGTTPSAGADTTADVQTTATFNDPAGDVTAQSRVRDHIMDLIGRAPAGSSIDVVMYTFTENPVTDALGAAHDRGVNVKVILDHTSVTMTGGEYSRLVTRLGSDRSQRSWVYACPAGRGCIGTRQLPNDSDGAINHNKFFLFSSTGGASKVVVQTSANMTNTQRTDLFNNAVTLVDSGLYDIYQAYFADLLKYGTSASGLSHYYLTPTSATGPYKAYFFPRREASGAAYNDDASTDTIKLILDNVSCTGGTQVRMAANLFTRKEVASKLVSLKNAGCAVTLAHDGNPGSMGATVESILYGKLTKRVQCYETRDGGLPRVGLHSKYLLIDGTYNGSTGRKLVFTGSHNYTYPALRANDETLLKIENATLYAQYKADHDHLMAYCEGS